MPDRWVTLDDHRPLPEANTRISADLSDYIDRFMSHHCAGEGTYYDLASYTRRSMKAYANCGAVPHVSEVRDAWRLLNGWMAEVREDRMVGHRGIPRVPANWPRRGDQRGEYFHQALTLWLHDAKLDTGVVKYRVEQCRNVREIR